MGRKIANRGRVLLLEDEEGFRRCVNRNIKDRHDLVACATSEDANSVLRTERFDLVLVDIHLGKNVPSGIDFLPQIAATGHRGTVCMLTGFLDPGLMHEALLSGADDYLIKGGASFTFAEVERLVELGRLPAERRLAYRSIADLGFLRSLKLTPEQIRFLAEMLERDFPPPSELADSEGLGVKALYERLRRIRSRFGATSGEQLARFLTVLQGYVFRSHFSITTVVPKTMSSKGGVL